MIGIEKYRAKMKTALERFYEGKCTVYVRSKVKAEDGSTTFVDLIVYADIPCRLSHESFPSNQRSEQIASRSSSIKLYLDTDKQIPSGSRIEVTQYGESVMYWMSGQPKIYSTHQEIELSLKEVTA